MNKCIGVHRRGSKAIATGGCLCWRRAAVSVCCAARRASRVVQPRRAACVPSRCFALSRGRAPQFCNFGDRAVEVRGRGGRFRVVCRPGRVSLSLTSAERRGTARHSEANKVTVALHHAVTSFKCPRRPRRRLEFERGGRPGVSICVLAVGRDERCGASRRTRMFTDCVRYSRYSLAAGGGESGGGGAATAVPHACNGKERHF